MLLLLRGDCVHPRTPISRSPRREDNPMLARVLGVDGCTATDEQDTGLAERMGADAVG